SQFLTLASVIGLPSPVFSADTAGAVANANARRQPLSALRVDMLDLPFVVDAPAGDAVIVLVGEAQWVLHGLLRLAPRRHEFCAQRLGVAALVPGAALQHGRLPVPAPGHHEAGERFGIDRTLQRGFAPALATVGRDHDPRDASGTGIGHAGDGVEAGLL